MRKTNDGDNIDFGSLKELYEDVKTCHDENMTFYHIFKRKRNKKSALLMKTIEVISSDELEDIIYQKGIKHDIYD